MAGDIITRRVFLGYSAALPLTLESLASGQSKEDNLWENARKNAADGQKALDETMKGLGAAQKLVSRFNAEKQLRDTLKQHAEAYAASKKDARPETLKDETERAFKFMAAELIDRAENKEQTTPSITNHLGADAYLHFRLWGTKMPSIGIATRAFFEDTKYKKPADFMSYLLDHVTYGKAADQVENPPVKEVWIGNKLECKVGDLWVGGIGRKDFWDAVLKNRWWNKQAGDIMNKARTVSDDYAKEMANAWENSAEFRAIVKLHLENSNYQTANKELKESLADTMGSRCGFKYLPADGKIVAYDPSLVD